MTDSRKVKWTRRLVLAGILLGYLSYGTSKLGVGELYPFAHWRLYSEPVGINSPVSTFRVYSRGAGSETWSRHSMAPTEGFTRKEMAYVLNSWARDFKQDPRRRNDAEYALKQLATLIAPGAEEYRIVEESFYSLPVYEDAENYDTTIVAVFVR